jgi:hypothetical protein
LGTGWFSKTSLRLRGANHTTIVGLATTDAESEGNGTTGEDLMWTSARKELDDDLMACSTTQEP